MRCFIFFFVRLASAKFPSNHFDYVFIDEAGYATEPECMTAVAGLLVGGKFVTDSCLLMYCKY